MHEGRSTTRSIQRKKRALYTIRPIDGSLRRVRRDFVFTSQASGVANGKR